MINPDLDINAIAKSFALDKRIKINNFMQQSITERMHLACKKEVPFNTHYALNGQYQSKTMAEMSALSPQEAQAINKQVLGAASQGVGFLYQGYLETRKVTQANAELSFLHKVFDYLSDEKVLNLVKEITGDDGIIGAELQYTRYIPGNFLTRHRDDIPGRGRRYAFVLGLTKNWHPDWGGLLQFYENDGTPRDAWAPQFNVMSIFDISHVHSVTYVTPFAREPRLSLTGWFVGKP